MGKMDIIFKNKTLSNKEKIDEMNVLFLDQIHPFHVSLAE